MKRLLERWDDYWFQAESPTNLGLGRMLYCGLLFYFFRNYDAAPWALLPEEFWFPHGFFDLLSLGPLPPTQLWLLGIVWKLSLLLACVGLFTRWSLGVALLTSLYMIGLPQNFAKVGHGEAVAVLVLAVLTISRSADAFSVDSWLRGRRTGGGNPEASGHYRWPVRAVWLVTSTIFLSAGMAKLHRSGLEWIFSDTLATLLIHHQYYHGGTAWTKLGLNLAQIPAIPVALAGATVLLECGLWLGMLNGWLRLVLAPSGLAMLLGFAALLGPFFLLLMGTFVFWVPWDDLAAIIRAER
jgi:hypothetical protein